MSAFMIDRKDYLTFAIQLHRFCNAPMPPHYTLELLRSLWWNSPMDVMSAGPQGTTSALLDQAGTA